MKNKSKIIYKCKTKYKNRIKYIKLPLIDKIEDIEIKYNIDTINIQSSEILSKQNLFIGLMLLSGIMYFIL